MGSAVLHCYRQGPAVLHCYRQGSALLHCYRYLKLNFSDLLETMVLRRNVYMHKKTCPHVHNNTKSHANRHANKVNCTGESQITSIRYTFFSECSVKVLCSTFARCHFLFKFTFYMICRETEIRSRVEY
jgi:hypothetical protein